MSNEPEIFGGLERQLINRRQFIRHFRKRCNFSVRHFPAAAFMHNPTWFGGELFHGQIPFPRSVLQQYMPDLRACVPQIGEISAYRLTAHGHHVA